MRASVLERCATSIQVGNIRTYCRFRGWDVSVPVWVCSCWVGDLLGRAVCDQTSVLGRWQGVA